MATTKKKKTKTTTRRPLTPKAVVAPGSRRVPLAGARLRLGISELRRRFPETAPGRYSIGETEAPLTLVLDDGSSVTKSRGATLVVEYAASTRKFRVELRSE